MGKKKKLAKEILFKIISSPFETMERMEDLRHYQSAYIKGGFDYIDKLKDGKEKKYLKEEINRLKRQDFIEERKRGDKLYLCLTEKGKKAALKYKILKAKNTLKDDYCIVAFDIPESERNIRDFFRRFLKEANFTKLQQSIWISQKNVAKELTEIVKSAGAEKWISVITANYVSNFKTKNNN